MIVGTALPSASGTRSPAGTTWDLRRALALLFVVFVLPTCVVLALLTPLGEVADEPAHIMRVGSLLHGQWIGRRAPALMGDGTTRVMAGLDVDQALLGVLSGPARPKPDRALLSAYLSQGWAGFLYFYQIPSVSIYMPVLYAPAAVGMGIAKLAGAGPFVASYAARLVNTACFVAIGLAALLLARRGHALLFTTLTLPMTVSLGASVNQDGLIIAGSALAAALLTRSDPLAPDGPALPRHWDYWVAAAILGCIVAAKLPYAPLLAGLMMPLPPLRSWMRLRRPLLLRAGAVMLVLLPALLWAWFALSTVATPYDRPPYEAGPLWPGPRPAVFDGTNAAAQLSVLLADPTRMFTLPWTTIIHDSALRYSAVGVLGWLDILLPKPLYTVWYVAAVAAVLCDGVANRPALRSGSWRDLALGLAGAAACVLLIYLSQYLTWTAVGHADVQGPSGRYLLPIIPLVALCLPTVTMAGAGRVRAGLAALPAVAAALGVAVLPPLVVYSLVLR